MRTSRRSLPQYINCRYQCQLGHVSPGLTLLVAVCILVLPMLEVATDHVQLKATGHRNHTRPDQWCIHPCHMTKHVALVLPSLHSILPAMVLQNGVVKSNMWCLSCSLSHSSVHCVSSSLGLSVPFGMGRRVVGIVVLLLLLMSGDVETNPGPIGNKLTSDDLGCVLEEVLDMSTQWYHLGLQLRVRTGTLDRIRTQFPDPKDQLVEMLKTWLTTSDNPSWESLINALRSRSVGASQLASVLETKYCLLGGAEVDGGTSASGGQPKTISSPAPVSHPMPLVISQQADVQQSTQTHPDPTPQSPTMATPSHPPTLAGIEAKTSATQEDKQIYCSSESSEDTHPSRRSSITSPPASEKPPFGCGCGKCTFFNFIERGCPKPIPTASSFPYLDLSRLNHEQKQELRGRLRLEYQEIMMQFQKLVSATMISLEKQQIPLTKIVSHIMTLGAFDQVYDGPQVPAFHHQYKDLQAADTVSEIFLILKDYFSFFNYHIIEHIITVCGTREDKDNLQRYTEDFDQYAKRRIFECHPQFGSESEMDHADVFVKVDSQHENYTVTEVERFRCQLSKILRVSSQGVLRLCRVEKGCFRLMFQVASFVQQKIFPLSREQERALAEERVISLTCGKYQFRAKFQSRPKLAPPRHTSLLRPAATRSLSTERRIDCIRYNLLGSCILGEKCYYRHVTKADVTYTDYVPFPEQLPISLAVGSHARNLKSAMPASLWSKCIVVPTSRPGKREVKVVTTDQQILGRAVENLQVIFSELYPIRPSWCYFHTEGLTENILLEFHSYWGRLPAHYQRKKMFEVYCRHQADDGTCASIDTTLEDFEKLNPKQSPLDSWEQLHSALDDVMEKKTPAGEMTIMHPGDARSHMRARIMLEYRDDIKRNLQGALEWMCKPENQQPGTTAKLEGRFGKILWFNLPDVLEPWSVKTFAEFVFSDTDHSQFFNTDVKSKNASSLRTTLQDNAVSTAVLETFDIKYISKGTGTKMDLRLKNNSGSLEVVVVKKEEQKVVVFDLLCLHRKHDVRLSLSRYETVPKENETVQKLLRTLTMCDPETLQLVPRADEWVIRFIRHKKRETFFYDEKYIVTVTTVKEHDVDWKLLHSYEAIVVKPEDYDEPHVEVEFHNILWEYMFGKAIGLSPEQSLALFMEAPTTFPKVASLIPPDPWDVGAILKDMDEVFEKLDILNESLGAISEK